MSMKHYLFQEGNRYITATAPNILRDKAMVLESHPRAKFVTIQKTVVNQKNKKIKNHGSKDQAKQSSY